MSRRGKGPREERGAGIAGVYEGPEVLSALLRKAGSPHDAHEVAARFAQAQEDGTERAEVIPGLFPAEPRFDSPDDARRLYGNLFGLWTRLAQGLGAEDDAPAGPATARFAMPKEPAGAQPGRDERKGPREPAGARALPEPEEPDPDLPVRGSAPGNELPAEVVEAVWKFLATAPHPEVLRRRDRFTNVQPDLVAWLDSIALPDASVLAALDLAFEAWAMFDQAFGDRLRPVEYRELRAAEADPAALREEQPAFAAYVGEQLDLLTDEDPSFDPASREQVEAIAAIVAGALTRAVQLLS